VSSPTHGFDQHLAKFTDQTVLCVGDLMLDEFHYGSVTRISPEAPTPVIAVAPATLPATSFRSALAACS
jgi:D-beta-D-heptose 7-phosphate kinase/D-beta-D-heptose 1-phosphate adenosyltransferase